jgi:hypothetical protein
MIDVGVETSLLRNYVNFRLYYLNYMTLICYVFCIWTVVDSSYANDFSLK